MYKGCVAAAGLSFFDMDRTELLSRYAAVSVDSARGAWEEMYESCLEHCMHGESCNLGAACNQGRRITTVRPSRATKFHLHKIRSPIARAE